ncbi:hypothetical protein Q7P35_002616 [Cladosporium inversicolor]
MQILMPQIRVRKPFAAAFVALCLIAAYLGLTPNQIPQYGQSDKGLHFVTFFLLTLTFYWILETSRRRLIHLTLLLITGLLAISSEILQALLPNDRDFDPFDILANVLGSGLALAACSWYHRRMLERRRRNKHYNAVPGEDEEGLGGEGVDGERDLELGDVGEQETGRIGAEEQQGQGQGQGQGQAGEGAKRTVTEELDHWDENAEDEWEETDADASAAAGKGGK